MTGKSTASSLGDKESPPVKAFALDRFRGEWLRYVDVYKRGRELKKQEEEFKQLLKEVAKDATEFTLSGSKVAGLVPGQLNKSKLAAEQPDLVEEYTRTVTKRVFDEDAFRQDHPKLWEQYRASRLVLEVPKTIG